MNYDSDMFKDNRPSASDPIQRFARFHGVQPSTIHPKTFNEKVVYRMLFDRRAILTEMTDKAAARRYVEARVGPTILPKLYFLGKHPEEIPFDRLPSRFVVKPTHGSGWIYLVRDKRVADIELIVKLCRDWLRRDYFALTGEWAYKNVEPHIIVEEFIDDSSLVAPIDYKCFVFDGVVRFIQVDVNRFSDHRRSLYSTTWVKLDARLTREGILGEVPRPTHLEEMLDLAGVLSDCIDFVRVDFYDTRDRLVFGELTTTPGCGVDLFNPPELDLEFGGYWNPWTNFGHSSP